MLNVSPVELLMVLMVGLIVLGPQKLPQIARQVGKTLAEVRRMASGFEREFRDAVKEFDVGDTTPPSPSPQGPTPLARPPAITATTSGSAIDPPPPPPPAPPSGSVAPDPTPSEEPARAEEAQTPPLDD